MYHVKLELRTKDKTLTQHLISITKDLLPIGEVIEFSVREEAEG